MTKAHSQKGKELEKLAKEYHDSKKELERAKTSYEQKRKELKELGISPTCPNKLEKISFEEFVKQDPDFAYIIKDDKTITGNSSDSALFLKHARNGNTIGIKLYKTGSFRFGGIATKKGETKFAYSWQYGGTCRWFQEKLELIAAYREMIREEEE